MQASFDLSVEDTAHLFSRVLPIAPSDRLTEILNEGLDLAIATSTEKARSELLISPILMEVRRILHKQISLFSGNNFDVEPKRGLNGFCDFILSASATQSVITAPVLTVVEAKENDLRSGLGQCIAEMVGAQIFNQRRGLVHTIYGTVTTGTTWRFLKLDQQTVYIDLTEYFINQLDLILGILALPFQE
ncbi:MAG: hypothetical protein ACKPCM_09025 [Pseudanabaena sp.]